MRWLSLEVSRHDTCVIKMREDLGHRAGLSPQIIQAHNAFADELDEAYDILKSDATDIDNQIRSRYISIIDSRSQLSADLYTNLASTRRRVSDKLNILAILQERQQVSQRCTEVTIIASKKRHYIGAGTLEPRQRALRAQGWPAQWWED